jgi:arylsulfatase
MYLDGEGHLCYEYSFSERIRHRARAPRPVPPGRQTFEYRFSRTGPRCGTGSLWIDGVEVASVDIPKTWPVITMTGGVHCGRDGGNPVSDAYTPPFPFTGTLHRVRVEVGADGTTDPNATLRADLAEQ